MSSMVDKCMEEDFDRRKEMSEPTKLNPCDVVVEDIKKSTNPNNPFCYSPSASCPCKLNIQECLLQNSPNRTDEKCAHYRDYDTAEQREAREKIVVDLQKKVSVCNQLINSSKTTTTIIEKAVSCGCATTGCLIGATFIMLFAGFGLLVFKWSCQFLLWVADKF